MTDMPIEVVAAGHICLDLIPSVTRPVTALDQFLAPGKLVDIGPVTMSTGGAVSNTGLALHRLGLETRLMGKVGEDLFGRGVLDFLEREAPALSNGMILDPTVATSYTVVVSPPGIDRCFLHCPGANDTFRAQDIRYELLQQARLFHFGYPPLMKCMYADTGRELTEMCRRARETGVTVSLDMALADPESEAGRQDWVAILEQALPFVDIFLPSLDEIKTMLNPVLPANLAQADPAPTAEMLTGLSDALLARGAAVVVLKLGSTGLYLRTSANAERLQTMGRTRPANLKGWADRELLAPCFDAEVVGATGAGDCTIAGFLAGMVRGLSPEETMLCAVGTGSFNVEVADAVSGIPDWQTLERRIQAGWSQMKSNAPGTGWRFDPACRLWKGPKER